MGEDKGVYVFKKVRTQARLWGAQAAQPSRASKSNGPQK